MFAFARESRLAAAHLAIDAQRKLACGKLQVGEGERAFLPDGKPAIEADVVSGNAFQQSAGNLRKAGLGTSVEAPRLAAAEREQHPRLDIQRTNALDRQVICANRPGPAETPAPQIAIHRQPRSEPTETQGEIAGGQAPVTIDERAFRHAADHARIKQAVAAGHTVD